MLTEPPSAGSLGLISPQLVVECALRQTLALCNVSGSLDQQPGFNNLYST